MVLAFLSHPLVLAIVAVAAVGLVAYEIISEQEKRRQQQQRRGPRSPPSPPPPRSPPPSPPGNGNPGKGGANNVRKRKPRSDEANKEVKSSPNTSFPVGNNVKNSDCHTKVDESNVHDGSKNDSENINNFKDEGKVLEKSTSDGDSVFSQNDLNVQPLETKLLNTSDQSHCKESNRNVEGSSSDFVESDYKEAVREKIQNDLNKGQSLCMGCEIETADAVCEPCGHRYLCSKCAESIFQIYGRCTICDEEIKYVSQ